MLSSVFPGPLTFPSLYRFQCVKEQLDDAIKPLGVPVSALSCVSHQTEPLQLVVSSFTLSLLYSVFLA